MKVDKLVPEIYYKESRDFSYVGRLFEVLFNYLKTNVDLVGESLIFPINEEASSSIIELLSTSLGFESKHKYQNKDLIYLCSVFAYLLRNKGNKHSIEDAITTLLRSQSINDSFDISADEDEDYKYVIYVPKQLNDIVLLEDIYEYILPTGWNYTIRTKASGGGSNFYTSKINMDDIIGIETMTGTSLGQVGGHFDVSTPTNIVNDYNTIDVEQEMWITEYINLSCSAPFTPVKGDVYFSVENGKGALKKYNGNSWEIVIENIPSTQPEESNIGDRYYKSVNSDSTLYEIYKCAHINVNPTNRSMIYTSVVPGKTEEE